MNREEKKRITRQKIFDTAIRLISENGYAATTVEIIAKEAGVAKGTFFNYFKSKESVLDEYERVSLFTEAEGAMQLDGPISPAIIMALINVLQKMNYTRSLRRATVMATLAGEDSLAEHRQNMKNLAEIAIPFFVIGQERGEFSKDYPPELLADLLIQTYIGILTHWCMGGGDDDLIKQAALSLELFLASISKNPH
ncbi:TetR/AcrR family transcriptional regulator [Bacillus sp. M6-12]|uniref:TetR/AcrR family transcriptional regulator n=1 Tax=Bacillus sp. M6-12 TaxID=2054166 RepID=UPI0015E0F12E|nr:TetR/AcrR family transcriptional regulator [Bacillus sp. M6-12]